MRFFEHLNLFGVDARQIPCIKGEGAPTTATEGVVGCLYMDTLTGELYKCISESGYVKATASGTFLKIDDALPTSHSVNITATCPNGVEPTSVSIKACGKNFVDMKSPARTKDVADITVTSKKITVTPNSNACNVYYMIGKADAFIGLKDNNNKIVLSCETNAPSLTAILVKATDPQFTDQQEISPVAVSNTAQAWVTDDMAGYYIGVRFYVTSLTVGSPFSIENVQAELKAQTAFEEYKGTTCNLSESGKAAVNSITPLMYIFTDTAGVTIKAEYNKDTQEKWDEIANNSHFADGVKATASGTFLKIDDASSVSHSVNITATCPNGVEPTSVSVKTCGKNFVDMKSPARTKDVADITVTSKKITVTPNSNTCNVYYMIGKADALIGLAGVGTKIVLSCETNAPSLTAILVKATDPQFTDQQEISEVAVSNTAQAWLSDDMAGYYIGARFYVTSLTAGSPFSIENVQAEIKAQTDFEEYKGTTCNLSESGKAAVNSITPLMYIFTDTAGVTIKAEYNQDPNKKTLYDPSTIKFAMPKWAEMFDFEEKPYVNEPNNIYTFEQFYQKFHELYTEHSEIGLEEIKMDTEYLANNTDAIPSYISGITNGGLYMYHLPAPALNEVGFFGPSRSKRLKLLLVSGTHGGEKKSIWDNYYLLKALCEDAPISRALTILRNFCDIYIIPLVNPSGIQSNTYHNANDVNLNRDFVVSDWSGSSTGAGSEPNSQYETRCISWWLRKISPDCVVDHHTSGGDEGHFVQWGDSCINSVASLIEENIVEITPYIRRKYPDKFANYRHSFGHVAGESAYDGCGLLIKHCHENGIIAAIYEVSQHLKWSGNTIFGFSDEDETALMTIAYHGYINFLMKYIQHAVKLLDGGLWNNGTK